MNLPVIIGLVLGAYLVGAIPNGLIYGLYIEGVDLREIGSGNIGATNVLRNFGWLPGIVVLILDIAKGFLPVFAVDYWEFTPDIAEPEILLAGVGIASVVGHIYPVYLKFSGGKGVATATGVFLLVEPLALVLAAGVFLLVTGLSRYVSAGSLTGAISLPVLCWYFGASRAVIVLAVVLSLLVIWRHRKNIQRLTRGEEHPFYGRSSGTESEG